MCEAYTAGGDTLYKCDSPTYAGQTFRPIEAHTLEYIDLEMRGPLIIPTPVIQVFLADVNHKPTGPVLSRNRVITEQHCSLFTTGRVRFSMQPVLLLKDFYYFIQVSNHPTLGGSSAYWQYDAAGAQYPRGHRMSSPDQGVTWVFHTGSDFMFAEFGTPPLPEPEPPPPINNFAPVNLHIYHAPTHITICLDTATPCHLTCFYTSEEPLKHPKTQILRGLTVPWGTYYCFVSYLTAEQLEPGDTVLHTFLIPDWIESQTRWFMFKGQVSLQDSTSLSSIFTWHHAGATLNTITLRPNAPGDRCGFPWACTPCPNHYQCVDDIYPDDDTTWVKGQHRPYPPAFIDLYRIPFAPREVQNISRIDLIARMKGERSPVAGSMGFKSHILEFFVTIDPLRLVWTTHTHPFHDNPFTNLPWTRSSLDTLQLGLILGRTAMGLGHGYCTQINIMVRYYT